MGPSMGVVGLMLVVAVATGGLFAVAGAFVWWLRRESRRNDES